MKKDLLTEILNNHSYVNKSFKTYKVEEYIDISVQQEQYKIVIWGFNHRSDRFINLATKKYEKLINEFKKISSDIYYLKNKYHITLKSGIKASLKNIYGYIRVSTKGQLEGYSLEQQKKEILDRYPNAKIYEEEFTGKTINRPIFNSILGILKQGDILVVTKLDRFCRNTKEGLQYIDNLINKGVKIHILNMGIIEDTAIGKLIITNLLAFAEFERAMIVERTQTGKTIAKTKKDFREGRPKKYNQKQLKHALGMLSINGGIYSYNEVAEITGISKSTIIRENRKVKLDS
ncbi:recombinase family protein [Planotetraspora mira]|uniref:recombinase family protein n=1 Tax=Planotetraspora mira TaxID=58121 RepID=UPI003670CE7B